MTASGWTSEELERVGSAEELEIAPVRADGTLGRRVPIWVVRAGDELYVRSWRGPNGRWFRAGRASRAAHIRAAGIDKEVELLDADERADDAVDDAYREKYGRYPTYVEPMVSPQARTTTLRLVPRTGDPEAA